MEKDYIPFELALELKSLGFYEKCSKYFKNDGTQHPSTINYCYNFKTGDLVSSPLFSQVFRWFRDKYNLIFQINYLFNGNYQVVIHRNTHEYMELIQNLKDACVDEIPDNYSYEEAELECLKKLIEIIKINKYEKHTRITNRQSK